MDTWEVALIGQNEIRVSTQAGIAVEINRVFYHVSAYYDILALGNLAPNNARYQNDHMNLTRTFVSTHPIKHSAAWEKAYKMTQEIAEQFVSDGNWLRDNRRYNSLQHIKDINNQIKFSQERVEESKKNLIGWQKMHDDACIEHELTFHEALSE